MKKILVVAIIALLCSTQGFAQKSIQEFRDAEARVGDGTAEIHVRPTVTEVELMSTTRIEDEWTLTADDVAGLGGNIANIRAWGAFLSSKKHACDIVMNPLFMIASKPDGNYTVTVVGYPGIFTNWHPATSEDFDWIVTEKNWRQDAREVVAPVVSK
ncbi:MAG: hypothetical protein LUC26_03060 [Prevotella sp.]|nr:hypothetical protein [Prevotella sp.]